MLPSFNQNTTTTEDIEMTTSNPWTSNPSIHTTSPQQEIMMPEVSAIIEGQKQTIETYTAQVSYWDHDRRKT